jgi:hypothetical protein
VAFTCHDETMKAPFPQSMPPCQRSSGKKFFHTMRRGNELIFLRQSSARRGYLSRFALSITRVAASEFQKRHPVFRVCLSP